MPPQTGFASAGLPAANVPQTLNLCWMRGAFEPVPGRGVAGVYIIWRTALHGRDCLVVGEARDIASDLSRTFRESHVAGYAASGALEINWAAVASMHRPGIACYLAAALMPTITSYVGAARQIPVNLPT